MSADYDREMGGNNSSNNRPRALIADDDAAFLMLMERALSEAGFESVCVTDGARAIEAAVENQYQLIFLDNLMPKVNGLDACAEIYARLGDACPPIVVVTSGDLREDISEAFSAGATDYLVKPVNWHLFKHRLSGWIDQSKTSRSRANSVAKDEFLVGRDGRIVEIIERRGIDSLIGREGTVERLSDILPEDVASRIMSGIGRVLKTRGNSVCNFDMARGCDTLAFEAAVSARGRNKAHVEIAPVSRDARARNEVFRLAYIDPVTGVPNRHLFDLSARDRLNRARFMSRSLTLLCLTFDRLVDARPDRPFIRKVLTAAASSLSDTLRSSDSLVRFDVPDASSPPIASLDGVHFLIMIDHAESDEAVDSIIERVQASCQSVAVSKGEEVKLEPRIGVARFPNDGDDLDQLVDAALLATRDARQLRQSVRRFGGKPDLSGEFQVDLAKELSHALDNDRICLHYQPRIDLQTEQVVAAEALIRWQHPFRGYVPVAEILDIAATAGGVDALTEWTLREACRDVRRWNTLPGPIKVSINLSRDQLIRRDFADSVIAILEELNMDPAMIELEMREALLDCTENSLMQLQQLRDAGIGLIVDDFGSDRTSLLTLRRLRIDGFKVDHSLCRVASFAENHSGIYSIATAIAQARNAVLIAKGIESAEELAFVKARHCQQVQGFHVCQPLPADDFLRFVEETEQGRSVFELAASI